MRNTGNLLKWTQNSNNKSAKGGENRNWIHPPEALQKGHIAYIVKFLGNVDVDQPKGFNVIKESIRKLKFNQQVRKSEGSKVPKVELTISVEGVALQDPKSKVIMHQYPLHRISYCADDKVDKQFFSFIVKDSNESERHTCFVFMSDKLAEEITLSIGQAFDLAYKWPSKPTNKPTFRARQLDVSKPLPIYMSDDLPDLHECTELKRAVPQMPSGMEKEEESEHHLQRAMVAGSVIPTPEVTRLIADDLKWHDKTYPPNCYPPKQLIHITPFTMEQDVPEYDYDSEDLDWLNTIGKSNSITADKLEEFVDKWEKQSNYNIIDLAEAKSLTKEDEDTVLLIYDYWLRKRVRIGHTLSPAVRTEPIAGAPPNDSYVAFRKRRDKIQTRKNRKNDEASYEKMLKLRRNISRAVELMGMIQQREVLKKQLVQLALDTYKKRVEMRDFSGQYYKDIELVKTVRHAFTPISTNHYMSAMWKQGDIKKNSANAKYQDAKREKRHYRKRKHKSYDMGHLSSDEEMYSPPHKVQNTDDSSGKWSFRRNKHCSYLAPINSPEPVDPTFGFQPVYIQKNRVHKSLGLCRPRYGRGGRVILDRYTNDDDRWASLDYNIIEQKQYEIVEFKHHSDNDMSDYFSDTEIDCPLMEVNSEIRQHKTMVAFNWDNFEPEVLQGVADICKLEYGDMNKEKNEQGESILERWVNQNQPHTNEPTLALGADSEVVGCSQFRTTDLSEPRQLRSTNCVKKAIEIRFLDMEVQRKVMVLQQRVKELENENSVLRQRISDTLSGKIDVEQYMRQNGISDMLQVNDVKNGNSSTLINLTNGNSSQSVAAPPVPPRSVNNNGDNFSSSSNETKPTPSVGTRLEGLLLNEMENNFDPRTNNNSTTSHTPPPLLAPPPKPARDTGRRSQNSDDIFGLSPFKATPRPAGQPRTSASDPFGMDDFGQTVQNGSVESDMGLLDKRIKEMKDGFSRGLSMSTEDFSLESLDPLKK